MLPLSLSWLTSNDVNHHALQLISTSFVSCVRVQLWNFSPILRSILLGCSKYVILESGQEDCRHTRLIEAFFSLKWVLPAHTIRFCLASSSSAGYGCVVQ